MIAVVLPAFMASRTSIQVISSSHTVFGDGSGFAASGQLYGLAVQLPPPMFWPGAVACCASACVPASSAAQRKRAAFMATSRDWMLDVALTLGRRPDSDMIHRGAPAR